MCILLLSTAHPAYPFILLSNRDEVLSRPTAPLDFWAEPNQDVLGGRDLEREEQGTWLGITRQGRLAALTNFREEGEDDRGLRGISRGAISKSFLTGTQGSGGGEVVDEWARRTVEEVRGQDVGGFSLVFGLLRAASLQSGKGGSFPGLQILSNRSESVEGLPHIAISAGETHGLSNTSFTDTSWPKVTKGTALLQQAVQADMEICERGEGDSAAFADELFNILETSDMPVRKAGESWEDYVRLMRNSIFIPPTRGAGIEARKADDIASASAEETTGARNEAAKPLTNGAEGVVVHAGDYGTQKQTVILVDQEGKVTVVERTLYGEDGRRMGKAGERKVQFDIKGWWDRRT